MSSATMPDSQPRNGFIHPEPASAANLQTIGQMTQHEPEPFLSDDWAGEILKAWARGSANTLELARVLGRARARLPYGGWSQLWDSRRMPFSKRKAYMLVAVGQNLEGIDVQSFARLPIAWTALYYLSKLGLTTVLSFIQCGRIHPHLSLKEAKELLEEFGRPVKSTGRASSMRRRLEQFAIYVRENCSNWSNQDRQVAHSTLTALAGLTAHPAAPSGPVNPSIHQSTHPPVPCPSTCPLESNGENKL